MFKTKNMSWQIFFIAFPLVIFSFHCKTTDENMYTVTPSVVGFSITRDTSFETNVYIKNLSSEKLLISEIASACGCTVGTLKDSTVQPNDSVPLKIIFTPNPLSDTGKLVRFISIRTNGTPPIKSIELRGTVH